MSEEEVLLGVIDDFQEQLWELFLDRNPGIINQNDIENHKMVKFMDECYKTMNKICRDIYKK